MRFSISLILYLGTKKSAQKKLETSLFVRLWFWLETIFTTSHHKNCKL
uniref:Uncharacterized protein n=1 Tax=Siphoviridae sp. ct96x5 TaxID=2825367 RepID=A0A8S5PSY0_9CAUD|nr:MAG TPA: hypothetical protein [Siphoviridae sp. ct96x5]DAJ39342.1 MAG TPA: hypothetical protein [Caudoviricetes sp.]